MNSTELAFSILSPAPVGATVRAGDTVFIDGAPKTVSRVKSDFLCGTMSFTVGRKSFAIVRDGVARSYRSAMSDSFTEHTVDLLT